MLRLLIKDITVEKPAPKQALLHIRWQGGACSDTTVELPPSTADQMRYPAERIEQIRALATTLTDPQIAVALNEKGITSPTGKAFTVAMISWVRFKHRIAGPAPHPDEFTVDQVMKKFGVSRHVVYYWIEREIIEARQLSRGKPYWITLNDAKTQELIDWVKHSSHLSFRHDTKSQ